MRASSGWGGSRPAAPAGDVGDEVAEAAARLGGQFVAVEQCRGGHQQRQLRGAGVAVDGRDRLVAEAALGGVDDAFEGEVVGRLGDQAQVGDGVADFGALVETEAADDLVVEADGDEPLLELAGLELGADEDGDVVERLARAFVALGLLADPARFLGAVPDADDPDLVAVAGSRSTRSCRGGRSLCAMRPSAAARMWLVER